MLRPRFPLEASDVLAALAKGTLPRAGGIVFVRMVAARRQQ